MTIKKKLRFVSLLSAFLRWLKHSDAQDEEQRYSAVVKNFYELSYLSHTILLHPTEKKLLVRWEKSFSKIDAQLKELSSDKQRGTSRLEEDFRTLSAVYAKYRDTFSPRYGNPPHVMAYRSRLIGQIEVRILNLTADLVEFIAQSRIEREKDLQLHDLLLYTVAIVFGVTVLGIIRAIVAPLASSLQRLQNRIERVEGGAFDPPEPINTDDEIGAFSKTLEKMTRRHLATIEKLQELDQLKTLFIASMSHELRTPMNAIIGFSSTLKSGMAGPINPKQREHLERIHSAGKHLHSMILDVINLSKLEARTLPFTPERLSLNETVAELIEEFSVRIEGKGLSCTPIIDGEIVLYTDRNLLKKAIGNYLSNAVKFSEKGTITLAAQQQGNRVDIEVSDEGIGIDAENLKRLFHPFERLESPLKVKAGGAGLGLYLTKKIVTDLMGGEVYVKSSPESGSIFGFRIPAEAPPVTEAESRKIDG
jgi:signal transduction histidine kinase